MLVFQYHFINQTGKTKSGLVEARSLTEAKETLRTRGILVTAIGERSQGKIHKIPWLGLIKRKIPPAALITFTTQLAQLLSAGIPLYESLLTLEEQYRSETFHPILLSICEQIKRGSALSESLKQFPDTFSSLYVSLVAAGESVGTLSTALDKIAHLMNKQQKLKKQVSTALIYPTVLLLFSALVIVVLLTFVIPSLETLFEDRTVNRFTMCVIAVSRFLRMQWPFYLSFLGVLGGSLVFFLSKPSGKTWKERFLLSLPICKTLIIQSTLARFTRTLATLLEGGVSLILGLQLSRKVMHHPLLETIIEKAEEKIVAGSLLSIELRKSSYIPSLVPRMLAIGEEGGNATLMLHKIADLYEEETEKTVTRLTALIQPTILILMGGVVGLIMLAVLLPLTDISAFL